MANQGLSINARRDLLNNIFRGTAYPTTPAGTLYVALWLLDPGDDGQSSAELSGTAYARVLTTSGGTWATSATLAAPAVISNAAAVTFPTAGSAWGTTTYAAIWLTSTGTTQANFFARIPIASQVVASGNTAAFAIGALSFNAHFDP